MKRQTKPEFCIISPVNYLEYTEYSSTHLVLAHLADVNDTYANHYKRLSEQDDFIIMDNGAFELGESYNPDKLIELGHKVGADVIVLPDYPWQPASKTIDAAKQMIDQVKNAGFQTAFVPQSQTGDFDDWVNAYVWAAQNPSIDVICMSILGIPTALPHIPKSYARVVMTELLQHEGLFEYGKYHHYLGLNAGPALEIPPLIKMNAISSCDSSGPVWAAINGHTYSSNCDSYQAVKKLDNPVDFEYPRRDNEELHGRIEHNLRMTLDLFNLNNY